MARSAGRRARWLGPIVALGVLAAIAWGYRDYAARQRVAALVGRAPRLATSPERVVPGIWYLGGLQPSAAYVVEIPDGLILFDSGLDGDAGSLRGQMRQLGLDWRRIRAIFLTHAHGDHCGGAEFLRALAKAKVYAGRDDVPPIREGGPRDAIFSTFPMPGRTPRKTTVDVPLVGGEVFRFGDVRVSAIAAPGHTPGSTCYLVERDGLRAFFSGDVIMKLRGEASPRYPLDKPLGTYSTYLAPRYRGDASAYLATLRKLAAIRSPDLLLPGHPSADPTPESPALASGRWAEILKVGIADMEALLARRGRDGADFLDGRPKELLPGLLYLGDRRGSAVYGIFTPDRFWLVDAPGGPGLLGFVRSALETLGRAPRSPDFVLLTDVDAAETSGLADLLETCKPAVLAPEAGLDRVRGLCPAGTSVLPAAGLAALGLPGATPIPLRGRGSAPQAYAVALAGKVALLSGRIPIVVNQEAGVALFGDFAAGRGDVDAYLGSLDRLRAARPDLWLPLEPVDGQDARLYDDGWARVVDDNRAAIVRNLGSLGRAPPLK